MNKNGIYTYEMLTPADTMTSELVMKVTSDVNNGELVFTGGIGWSSLYYYTQYDTELNSNIWEQMMLQQLWDMKR